MSGPKGAFPTTSQALAQWSFHPQEGDRRRECQSSDRRGEGRWSEDPGGVLEEMLETSWRGLPLCRPRQGIARNLGPQGRRRSLFPPAPLHRPFCMPGQGWSCACASCPAGPRMERLEPGLWQSSHTWGQGGGWHTEPWDSQRSVFVTTEDWNRPHTHQWGTELSYLGRTTQAIQVTTGEEGKVLDK